MKARNRTDPSASQSVNLVCVNRNVETRDGQIGQIVAEREREIVATNVFLISRETPDKISTWHRECDWGTLGALAYNKMSYFGYKCCNRPGEQQKPTTINQEQK